MHVTDSGEPVQRVCLDQAVIFSLYLPAPTDDSVVGHTVKVGSAIVGSPATAGALTVDYEGSIYAVTNASTYAERAGHAADRHASRYPTQARMTCLEHEVIEVGYYDDHLGITHIDDQHLAMVLAWIGCDEQTWQSTQRLHPDAVFEMRRGLDAGLRSDDPQEVERTLAWARARRMDLPDWFTPGE